jgi:hypothetical protein
MAANTKLITPPEQILRRTYDKMKPRPEALNPNDNLAWAALMRRLDKNDPSYRN